VLFAALLNLAAAGAAADEPAAEANDSRWDGCYLRDGETILFLGDSITYRGLYIEYIDACLATRFPQSRLRLINRGMPSETVAGTSEAVHHPPRPDLAKRFERTVAPLDPDVIVACYGMNDGIYQSPNPEILEKYQAGIERLIDRVRKGTRARLVLLSPPPFDIRPRLNQLKPAAPTSYMNPAKDYDHALGQFARWLMTLQKQEGPQRHWRTSSPLVIDLHSPINAHLARRREEEPGFLLARDGIHPNATGHWLIARQILLAFGIPGTAAVAEVSADAKDDNIISGDVRDLRIFELGVEFVWNTSLPMPADVQWDPKSVAISLDDVALSRYTLRVTGLAAGYHDLYADGRKFGTATDVELANGIDLTRYAEFPTVRESAEVLGLVRTRQELRRQLWLKEETHPRLAAEHARLAKVAVDPNQEDELSRQIRRRCRPRDVQVKTVFTGRQQPAPVTTLIEQEEEFLLRDPDWTRDASPAMGLQGHRANQSSRRNAGSAAMLDGPTMIHQVFVSDRKSSWTEKREQEIRGRVGEAIEFLRDQGLKYQQRILIAQVIGEPVTLDEDIPTDSQADSGWTDRVIQKSSGLSCAALIDKIKKEQQMENVLLMLHLNKAGRSYNISYYQGVPRDLMSERLICFSRFNDHDQTPAATYAHEVLHGFGAGDLYFPFDQDDDRYRRAKRLFPNDVMLRIDDQIARLSVDPWTAYRVGWIKNLQPELRFLEDPR